ncbi:DNA double-strand break repair nuclease NurA [Candidatus Woesearchaeota archaeon]|nr:DNA double-strand break repair nuclease NurA [Candidatus Woesearchaeota archaeon]
MYDEIINKILELIGQKSIITEAYPKFSREGYKPYHLDVKNFHEIKKSSFNRKIAFVDGGNAEIISSANFSLSIMRVACLVHQDNKKILQKKFDIFVFVQAMNKNNEIHYKAAFFDINNSIGMEEISFSSFDTTLMLGSNRAEIGSAANAIRRFAELKMAKIIADENASNIIILDGDLQCTMTHESKYLAELYESCMKNKIVLGALSKTTSLFTDNGDLLSVALANMSPFPSWYYHPIADIKSQSHKAEMFFVKLHGKANHIFKFEVFNNQKAKAEEAINGLAGNCADPVFLGYPYGLIDADRIARISNAEKESLRTMFLARLRGKDIESYINSVNAHEILDRISF